MYSRRYDRAKKKARRRRTLMLAAASLFLFLLFFLPYLDGKIREFKANGNQFSSQPSATAADPTPKTEDPVTGTTTPVPATKPAATTAAGPVIQTLTHELPEGTKVQIQYEVTGAQTIRYTSVEGDAAAFSYDISPDGTQVLINAQSDQSLVMFGPDRTPKDHSVNTYSHRDRGTLERAETIRDADFLWMGNARFMTGEVILFESELSLAMDRTYIWYYNIPERIYKLISGTGSETTRLVRPAETGYEILIDGQPAVITPDLEVAE